MLFGPFSLDEIAKDPFQFDSQFTLSTTASEVSLCCSGFSTENEYSSAQNFALKNDESNDQLQQQRASNSSSSNAAAKHQQNQRYIRPNRNRNANANTLSSIVKELAVNSSYSHNCQITSRLVFLPDNKIAFGDSSHHGCVNVKDWSSGPKFQILPHKGNDKQRVQKVELKGQAKISPKPLTYIEYYENGTTMNPLLFTVDSNHDCRVSSLSTSSNFSIQTTAVFPLFDYNAIYVDKKRATLYLYLFDEGKQFKAKDLRTDQFMSPIVPKFGHTRGIKCFNNYDDIVAVCSDSFEMFDLRQSSTEPVKSVSIEMFANPPLSMRVIDDSIPSFALAMNGHVVVYLDSRHEKCFRSVIVECMCNFDKMVTCGFDFSRKSNVAAIGTEHGVTSIQMSCNLQSDVVNKKNSPSIAYSRALLFHPEKYELAFVSNNDMIITAI